MRRNLTISKYLPSASCLFAGCGAGGKRHEWKDFQCFLKGLPVLCLFRTFSSPRRSGEPDSREQRQGGRGSEFFRGKNGPFPCAIEPPPAEGQVLSQMSTDKQDNCFCCSSSFLIKRMVLRRYGEKEDSAAFCLKDPLFCNRRKADLSPFFDATSPCCLKGGAKEKGKTVTRWVSGFGVGTNQNWGREAVVERPVIVCIAEHRECPGEG